jgi:K+-transporting ATPase A subunit
MYYIQVWLTPALILIVTTILAIPLSKYLAWIMNGEYKALFCLRRNDLKG